MDKQRVSFNIWWPDWLTAWQFVKQYLLPTPGNVVFTLLIVGGLLFAQSAGAFPSLSTQQQTLSTGAIAYQGRLADTGGSPLTGAYNMIFRLYNVTSGGTPLWEEQWTGSNSVSVSDGLFNVMLGSLTLIPQSVIVGNNTLYLGITVGTDNEMTPRVQLGSVPFAVQALTVPDGSVTTAKLNVDNGLSVSGGDLAVAGNISLLNGSKEILFSDPGNCDFSIVHNGGASLDFRTPECDGTLLMNIYSNGSVFIPGSFSAGGTKSAIVNTANHGQLKLYAIESPEVRFADEGLAQSENGVAYVDMDPIFLETIEGEYLVHVTPYGNASLYVAEVGIDYFVVKVRDGNPDVAFAWRLSAYRKGYTGVRLEAVDEMVNKRIE